MAFINIVNKIVAKNNLALLGEIIENRLKKKIISYETTFDSEESKSYIILTDQGYVEFSASTNFERIKIEKEVLELCKVKGISVPQIILYDKVDYDQLYFVLLGKIKGEPFDSKNLHIFDYNLVLTKFAEHLLKLHKIQISGYGSLNSHLTGIKKSWSDFLNQDLEENIKRLQEAKIFPYSTIKALERILNFGQIKIIPRLLHGYISTNMIFIDHKNDISSMVNFTQPISGDPNYEMAGFLVYEGLDRTKRLVKLYYLLGGLVEWGSSEFLKISLRRLVNTLDWRLTHKDLTVIQPLVNLTTQLIKRGKVL